MPNLPSNQPPMPMRQARYWIATIPRADWSPHLPEGVQWISGQPELGQSGYAHWQFVFSTRQKISLRRAREIFVGTGHYEPTRSDAARAYVNKEATRDGEPFEFGSRTVSRNSGADWDAILESAKAGSLDTIPADVFVRYYRTLRSIAADYASPQSVEKQIHVFYGPTGTGKSWRAWNEAGMSAYPKDPRSKFWYGYKGQKNVVIDEFRGGIDISHLLRWFDRYPVNVELKGSSTPLLVENVWITSNLHPDEWFVGLDEPTLGALKRRLVITHIPMRIYPDFE